MLGFYQYADPRFLEEVLDIESLEYPTGTIRKIFCCICDYFLLV